MDAPWHREQVRIEEGCDARGQGHHEHQDGPPGVEPGIHTRAPLGDLATRVAGELYALVPEFKGRRPQAWSTGRRGSKSAGSGQNVGRG